MIAGHFGLAAMVKSRERTVPLWTLMLACQWLDILFVPLLLTGVERVVPLPGTVPGAYGKAVIYGDYTHSLVGASLVSLLFGVVAGLRYGRRGGLVLGLVAMSHWLLDLPMHRADLPILPGALGDLPRLGFGLWRWPVVSAALELVLVVAGGVAYWAAAREVAGTDPAALRRARLCGALVLGSGLLVLALNVAGL